MYYFIFTFFEIQYIFYTYSTSQLKLDIFHVLSCHMWLVAMALGNVERNQLFDFTRENKILMSHSELITEPSLKSSSPVFKPELLYHTTCTQSPSPNTLSN